MGSIKVLPEAIASKIAAGEVIDRPASVIKELVENSIDAGSTEIIIEISSSGVGLIRITDNGCGMSEEDAKSSFLRYATSKIRQLEDLWEIRTMGFRGEALSSIAAVSRVKMVTKSVHDEEASQVIMEGGQIKEVSRTGAPLGTMIEVRDLFYQTPARRKFLKSEMTELGHITQILTQLALAHPRIDFRLIRQGKSLLEVVATDDPRERIMRLFGQEVREGLILVEETNPWGRISGWVAQPSLNRSNRTGEYTFVNSRAIANRSLSHAVMEGYHTLLPSKRFPIVFLYLTVDPKIVDVNVHPAKREVKFQQEGRVHDDVVRAIRETLQQKSTGRADQVREAVETYLGHANTSMDRNVFGTVVHTEDVGAGFKPAPTAIGSFFSVPTTPKIKVLCQFQNTYIVAEDEKGVLIYDQHAIHERVRYERLTEQFQKAPLESQPLLFPETLEVTPREEITWQENQELFTKIGFEIELFGEHTLMIRSAPAVLNRVDFKKFLGDLLTEIVFIEKGNPQAVPDQMLKTLACRSSVMAGEALDRSQLQRLVDDLQSAKQPQSCPHGRPTSWRVTREELAKRFQRK